MKEERRTVLLQGDGILLSMHKNQSEASGSNGKMSVSGGSALTVVDETRNDSILDAARLKAPEKKVGSQNTS